MENFLLDSTEPVRDLPEPSTGVSIGRIAFVAQLPRRLGIDCTGPVCGCTQLFTGELDNRPEADVEFNKLRETEQHDDVECAGKGLTTRTVRFQCVGELHRHHAGVFRRQRCNQFGAVQDAFPKNCSTRLWDAPYTIQGPLTWRRFHPLPDEAQANANLNPYQTDSVPGHRGHFQHAIAEAQAYTNIRRRVDARPVHLLAGASHLLNRPVAVARLFTPGINISSVSNALRNIQTSNLKFLPRARHHGLRYRKEPAQLGPLGCGVEPHRHQVPQVQEAGAEDSVTPLDVIEFRDGTNSCVSDPQEAKDLVFGNSCVMSANLVGKGFVQMTGGDPEKSQDIAKQIISKEAGTWMHNSKNQAKEGTLIILAAKQFGSKSAI
ncbi:3-hydroxyisobutyrate dehydrogenase [Culex quinquefasciatus]|uniref:3-hydroxyisobutyrate dehydrogenase n=1 Tax=Culex quinquefasciatus TaxID=7176 RepID=B0XCK5_CULQU|nr:3-hydroxyisobutyrate dehydrogenase [Culex quinquefasciatus]|eukprot:XP_001867377.1 3-hydroxyisobutyrate dehydrogenase [Culex quinquefasciatus]